MRLSEKYAVPRDLALLYDFVNSLDRRRYIERGTTHAVSDELSTPERLESWLRERSLEGGGGIAHHRQALEMRDALRSFLKIAPGERSRAADAGRGLQQASSAFALVVAVDEAGAVSLQPLEGASGIGRVLAQMHGLATSDQLHRLKMCASDECEWVFFDRSKPGNRRWCSSARCGNRQKTRAYRERRRSSEET
jgi:predicted RNA-binding Zn ribbon-like protein